MSQIEINKGALLSYVESQDWTYTIKRDDDTACILRMGFNVNSRINGCTLYAVADARSIHSIAVSPINADLDAYDQVVEYITRANYGLRIGKFEFDFDDGEIRFQSYLPCLNGIPDMKNIETTVNMPFMMFNFYGNGLAKAIMGCGDPEADIAEAEN